MSKQATQILQCSLNCPLLGGGGGTSKTSPKDGQPLGTDIKSYFTKISTKEGEVAWSYIRYKLVFEVKLYIQWISLNLTEA